MFFVVVVVFMCSFNAKIPSIKQLLLQHPFIHPFHRLQRAAASSSGYEIRCKFLRRIETTFDRLLARWLSDLAAVLPLLQTCSAAFHCTFNAELRRHANPGCFDCSQASLHIWWHMLGETDVTDFFLPAGIGWSQRSAASFSCPSGLASSSPSAPNVINWAAVILSPLAARCGSPSSSYL